MNFGREKKFNHGTETGTGTGTWTGSAEVNLTSVIGQLVVEWQGLWWPMLGLICVHCSCCYSCNGAHILVECQGLFLAFLLSDHHGKGLQRPRSWQVFAEVKIRSCAR